MTGKNPLCEEDNEGPEETPGRHARAGLRRRRRGGYGHGAIHAHSVPARRGGTDTLTRMIGSAISQDRVGTWWWRTKPGAGGSLALDATARLQSSSGHTLVMAQTDNIVLNPWLYNKLSYDTFKDFSLSAQWRPRRACSWSCPESPFKTVGDVVKAAQARGADHHSMCRSVAPESVCI